MYFRIRITSLYLLLICVIQVSSTIILYKSFKKKGEQAPTVLESPTVSDIGIWTNWDRCPRGTYIFGMRIQFLPESTDKYADNEGLIGVKFLCGEPYNRRIVQSEVGFSENEDRGIWTQNYFCEGPAQGFLVRNKIRHKDDPDDMGVTNFKLICPHFNETIDPPLEFQPGDWSVPLKCDNKKQALCGIMVQKGKEMFSNERVDSVGINRVRMECCDILRQSQICTPWDRWETIFEYDNTFGLTPAAYTYTKRVGVSKTSGITTVDEIDNGYDIKFEPGIESYQKLGIEASSLGDLKEKFKLEVKLNKDRDFEWHQASSDTFNNERSTSIRVGIEPGYKVRVYQIVGYCGNFQVRSDWIYQNGTFLETRRRGIIDGSGQRRLRFGWKVALGIITSALTSAHMYFG